MASESWGLQTPIALIGTETAPATLTTSYTDTTAIFTSTAGVKNLEFYFQYTPTNAGNSIQWKIEGSGKQPIAGVTPNFYQQTSESVTTGVSTISPKSYTWVGGGTSVVRIKVSVDINDMQIKLSVKETLAGGAAGTIAVYSLMSANQ